MSLEGSALDLQRLSEALSKAWRGRSATDRQAFEQGISAALNPLQSDLPDEAADAGAAAPETSHSQTSKVSADASYHDRKGQKSSGWPSESEIDQAAATFERIAAVSGAISPLTLKSTVGGTLADIALDRIASGFDRTRTASGWEWTLQSDRRATILADLSRPDIMQELASAHDIGTDRAGDTFRKLLRDGALSHGDAPLDADVIAHSWLDLIEPQYRGHTRLLRLETAKAQILNAYKHLLAEGFVGRDKDVERIRAFCEQSRDGGHPQLLSVTGIGGVGKSTLLAEALKPVILRSFKDDKMPILVSIDFDRRTQSNGAELELSFELTRQIELYYPKIGNELEALRETFTRDRISRGEMNRDRYDSERQSFDRHSYEFANRARPILQRHAVGTRPLLLVADTFEEWQRGQFGRWDSDNPMRRFLAWLAEIQNVWSLHANVIVSGRTPVSSDGIFVSAGVVDLKDLRRKEAVELLRRGGMTKREAQPLARIAGGNPLALKLASRYYERLPGPSRAAFLSEGAHELEGLETTLRQGILYRRFLDHIADPQARKLAHPGLALRRVTVDLVQHVLAGPCGLGVLNRMEAEDLLLRLAKEVWLVEGRWPVITHRPELRRVMLQAMQSDPAQSAKIHDVHLAAMRWYEQHGDNSDDDLAEALYHRLAAVDAQGGTIDFTAIAEGILQRIAPSAEDFSIAARAQILFRTGRTLSLDEARTLPPAARQDWTQSRASGLVRSGQPERALSLWQELGDGMPPGGWYAAAAFQAFDRPDIIMPFEANAGPHMESLRYDYLLAFSLRHDAPDRAARYRHWLRQAMGWQLDQAETFAVRPIALEAIYFETITDPAASLERRRQMPLSITTQPFPATVHQYLRMKTIFGDNLFNPNAKMFKMILSSIFCPTREFLGNILNNPIYFSEPSTNIMEIIEELGAAHRYLSSDELLGTWADRFAAAVAKDMNRAHNKDEFMADIIRQLRCDDPEWRVPIRTAVTNTAHFYWARERLAQAIGDILEGAVPMDLQLSALMNASARSTRKTWGRAIEYLDRVGRLGHFMRYCLDIEDETLHDVARQYLLWDDLRRQRGI